VSVAFRKVEGVEDVKVSLNEGTVALELKPGNRVTVDRVREIIRKNGFTPKDATVKMAGKVIERNGKPALEVTGLDLVLLLDLSKAGDAAPKTGQRVIIGGELPADTRDSELETLFVREEMTGDG
jgi:hypothetical protein